MLWKWDIDHPWREAATAFCWQQIDAGLPEDAHSFGEMLSFLAWVPDRERAGAVAARARGQLAALRMFRLDPSAPGYGVTPLHYAPAPDSRWIGLFEPSVIDAHLDDLAAAQRDDGGWPISWETIGPAAEATAAARKRSAPCGRCARSAACPDPGARVSQDGSARRSPGGLGRPAPRARGRAVAS